MSKPIEWRRVAGAGVTPFQVTSVDAGIGVELPWTQVDGEVRQLEEEELPTFEEVPEDGEEAPVDDSTPLALPAFGEHVVQAEPTWGGRDDLDWRGRDPEGHGEPAGPETTDLVGLLHLDEPRASELDEPIEEHPLDRFAEPGEQARGVRRVTQPPWLIHATPAMVDDSAE